MRPVTFRKVALVAVVAVALIAGATAFAKKPGKGGCSTGLVCPDVWDPVQCADGVIYSNQCYADAACAPKPCESVGGPVEL